MNSSLLSATFDFASILPFAVVGAIAVGGFVILEFLFNRKTRTESRLEQIRNRMSGKPDASKDEKSGLMKKRLYSFLFSYPFTDIVA